MEDETKNITEMKATSKTIKIVQNELKTMTGQLEEITLSKVEMEKYNDTIAITEKVIDTVVSDVVPCK